ncbi:sister chromatid cohesion protein Dcc1 [Dipodascopsis tothii]|uniref:sister chromatid cohesion protein Dcc1 n=1 Tax=Dipodascopsis tothii TaxID=44089 RepID=UPI0034CD66D6
MTQTERPNLPLFTEARPRTGYRLVQLPFELAAEIASNEHRFELKATDAESPVYLCSKTRTYQLLQLSQSNSLFLVTPEHAPDAMDIEGQAPSRFHATPVKTGYLECIPADPKPDLSYVPRYAGSEDLATVESELTYQELHSRTPVSETGLASAWRQAGGVEIDGRIYVLADDLVARLLIAIVDGTRAERLEWAALTAANTFGAVADEGEPQSVVTAVLRRFSDSPEEPYALNIPTIIKWFGERVLEEHGYSALRLADFDQLWAEALPTSLDEGRSLDLLKGRYVHPTPSSILYFPPSRLPTAPAARFDRLFDVKASWDTEDITPFLTDIEPNVDRINVLFMKHTKKKTVGKRTVVSRRGV